MMRELTELEWPDVPPHAAPETLLRLQGILLNLAEQWLGPRDASVMLLPPCVTLRDGGTAMRVLNMAQAELDWLAAIHWPHATRQLAHEVVHLLYGAGCGATVMEEGTATLFGMMVEHIAFGESSPVRHGGYALAADAVTAMSPRPYAVIADLRRKHGHMRDVTAAILRAALPNLDRALAEKLCGRFDYAAAPPWPEGEPPLGIVSIGIGR